MGTTYWPKDPLDGNDMTLLTSILRRWCARYGIEFTAEESKRKAKELIEWFEFGVKDPAELEELIDGKHWLVSCI
ncbi:hypothetical protein [Rhizobium bangladeshense]|uniref:hypothetical protein n=1 Tax=Rhizobium bangladeshense TaxID=1138189 RepID=UPI0007E53B9F|nr:hypothetical protein [Rhizobium bangladeshense]MBX4896592.1 hypothetical protein [Rhizobium bangladeshense]MBX4900609.1 hypothetical protein [Rhizobium bangladeshense]MBX4912816.1 hypothetical protein [Rhizobium bangladeshense]MBY3617190.1 hypothetical protein [Rhizobium bangladeshense]QSY93055.1 hypothetical protein J2J97_13520 [Rhizobium bangladeshense]